MLAVQVALDAGENTILISAVSASGQPAQAAVTVERRGDPAGVSTAPSPGPEPAPVARLNPAPASNSAVPAPAPPTTPLSGEPALDPRAGAAGHGQQVGEPERPQDTGSGAGTITAGADTTAVS